MSLYVIAVATYARMVRHTDTLTGTSTLMDEARFSFDICTGCQYVYGLPMRKFNATAQYLYETEQ